tara:strand:- start:3043 stop:4362 length:1320 start_codon:yes stop_codon:yes gene_type:complete
MTFDEFKRINTEGSQHDDSSATSEDSLDWAKEAYERLKKQQEEKKAKELEIKSKESNIQELENKDDKSLSNSNDQKQISIEKNNNEINETVSTNIVNEEDILGEFDSTFAWSAEVLAAQGKKSKQISLEEIDWLGRLRKGLESTRKEFVTDLLDKYGDDPLTPEIVDDLEMLLLRADAGVSATDQILEALRHRLNEEVLDAEEGLRFLKEKLCEILEGPISSSGVDLLSPKKGKLNIWLLVGVNGVGKTTTLGKLANLAVRSGYSSLIAAADTFRAAAVEQLKVWADRSSVSLISNQSSNADPAAVVFDAIGAAKAKGTDLLLVDTAGRLQNKNNLMEELKKVRKIIDKLSPEAKVESLLVLDSSQGQNGLRQAMAFAKTAKLTGVVITKLDGSSRGGVALAIASEANLPIRFIGAGEGIRDLRPFNSFEFVEALLAKG